MADVPTFIAPYDEMLLPDGATGSPSPSASVNARCPWTSSRESFPPTSGDTRS